MRVVIAPDSFKGSLPAGDVARALAEGLGALMPHLSADLVPMADGGEGTVAALVEATGGRTVEVAATGPLGDPVPAFFGILGDGRTAVVEMAAASGLPRVPPARRDPRRATTRGTGELIRAALDAGCRRLIVGIGGSATNDGGAGMAQALGVRLLDAAGAELPPGGAALLRLARVDTSGLDPRLAGTEVLVACDVSNPLTGPRGASRVFGPQKGADPAAVEELDRALAHYASVLKKDLGSDVADLPGAGAAGGLGAGLVAFLGAELRPGVGIVMQALELEARIEGAGLVITGEGRIDGQTAYGKVPVGVARAVRRRCPVIAVAGSVGAGADAVYEHGIDLIVPIAEGPITLEESIDRARELLVRCGRRLGRYLQVAARLPRPGGGREHGG